MVSILTYNLKKHSDDHFSGELTQFCIAQRIKCLSVNSTEEKASSLAKSLGLRMIEGEEVESLEGREQSGIAEVQTRDGFETDEYGNLDGAQSENDEVQGKKDEAKSDKDEVQTNDKGRRGYRTRCRAKKGGIGEDTQALVQELSELKKWTLPSTSK